MIKTQAPKTKTPELISRSDAKARGLLRYFTGKPCKRGLIAERKTSNGDCQCSLCLAAFKLHSKAWAAANPEKHREGAARRNKRWGDKNKVRKAETGRMWRHSNKAAVNAHTLVRRARRVSASPSWCPEIDGLVNAEAAHLCRLREAATGFAWHVDHMVPLQARTACGLHCAANLQVIPASVNVAKGNKMKLTEPGEWIQHL